MAAPEPYVATLRPSGGPLAGGTPVHICGVDLAPVTRVRFGSVEVSNVTVVTQNASDRSACVVARAAAAEDSNGGTAHVPVRVSVDGESWWGGDAAADQYYYYNATLYLVDPPIVPAAGGAALTMRGKGFDGYPRAREEAACRIGGIVTRASSVTDGAIVCAAPPLRALAPSRRGRWRTPGSTTPSADAPAGASTWRHRPWALASVAPNGVDFIVGVDAPAREHGDKSHVDLPARCDVGALRRLVRNASDTWTADAWTAGNWAADAWRAQTAHVLDDPYDCEHARGDPWLCAEGHDDDGSSGGGGDSSGGGSRVLTRPAHTPRAARGGAWATTWLLRVLAPASVDAPAEGQPADAPASVSSPAAERTSYGDVLWKAFFGSPWDEPLDAAQAQRQAALDACQPAPLIRGPPWTVVEYATEAAAPRAHAPASAGAASASAEESAEIAEAADTPLPLVYLPGIGSSCGIEMVGQRWPFFYAARLLPATPTWCADEAGLHRYSEVVPPGGLSDYGAVQSTPQYLATRAYPMNVTIEEQAARFAALVRERPDLARGFNLYGFSQGGLVARAYVQLHSPPVGGPFRVRVLVLGHSPLGGLSNLPLSLPGMERSSSSRKIADKMELAPRDYLKQCHHLPQYRSTALLARLNNERPGGRDPLIAERLRELRTLVLMGSARDGVIDPPEAQFFAFSPCDYDGYGTRLPPDLANASTQLPLVPGVLASGVAMRSTRAYAEDWIGLRSLDEAGRLHLFEDDTIHADMNALPCQRLFRFFDVQLAPLLGGGVAQAEREEAARVAGRGTAGGYG